MIEVGQIFETSWGYDQTNYDFIIVDSISPTGKTVKCRMARATVIPDVGGMTQEALKPRREGYGLPFTMRVKYDAEGKAYLRGSYPFCHSEADKPNRSMRLDTFFPVNDGQIYFETAFGFGH
jgi:hypothetical protein